MALILAIVLVFSSSGVSAAAHSDEVYKAYEEFDRIQTEQGPDAAMDYLLSLPLETQTEIVTGLTTDLVVTEEYGVPEFVGTSDVLEADGMTVTAVNCWARTDSKLVESAWFHANLFRYYVRTTWCGNGSVVTSASQAAWGEKYNAIWHYAGNSYVGSVWAGCIGCSYSQLKSEGIFYSEVPGVGTFVYRYPWIRTTVYSNGWSVVVTGVR